MENYQRIWRRSIILSMGLGLNLTISSDQYFDRALAYGANASAAPLNLLAGGVAFLAFNRGCSRPRYLIPCCGGTVSTMPRGMRYGPDSSRRRSHNEAAVLKVRWSVAARVCGRGR